MLATSYYSDLIYIEQERKYMVVEMSTHTVSKITDRFNSMFFLCMHCDNPSPLTMSDIGIDKEVITAFGICPNCGKKFIVKIEDYGRVT